MANKINPANPGKASPKKSIFSLLLGEKIDRGLLNKKFNAGETTARSTTDKITKSNIFVVTGHHWASRSDLGVGAFHPADRGFLRSNILEPKKNVGINLKKAMNVKMSGVPVELINNDMKLVMATGCNVIDNKEYKSAQFLHGKFPNAVVLGWQKGSEKRKNNYMNGFLKSLPDNLDVHKDEHVIIDKWKEYVHKMSTSSDPRWKAASNSRPGYISPDGNVFVYNKGKWSRSSLKR
jgi:hypothetical protein